MTDLLATPNIGTGVLERPRPHRLHRAARAPASPRVLDAMPSRDLDACFLGREANARYVSGVRRLWTAQSSSVRPCMPRRPRTGRASSCCRSPPSYEDIPEEVGPDHFFPVTWNPMNMMDRFPKTRACSTPGASGIDGLSPFFEGLLPPDPPRRRVRRRRGHDARAQRAKLPRGDRVPAHRGRDRRVGAVRRRHRGAAGRHRAPPPRRRSSSGCARSARRSSRSRARSP